MPSPPITPYMTTIASQPALRQRQEYIFRILQVKKIPFTTYDLASDEEAKRLWRRKAPADKQQLPGMLVGGKFPGTFAEFEDAVEHDELDIFLRLKENWDPVIDEDRPPPPVKPVGIPGASSPLQMTPEHLRTKMFGNLTPSPSPLRNKSIPVNNRTGELDLGDELGGFGLQGVKVTQDELADLVAELGLDGDDAGDLVKGLSDLTAAPSKDPKASKEEFKVVVEELKAAVAVEKPKVATDTSKTAVEELKNKDLKAISEEVKPGEESKVVKEELNGAVETQNEVEEIQVASTKEKAGPKADKRNPASQ